MQIPKPDQLTRQTLRVSQPPHPLLAQRRIILTDSKPVDLPPFPPPLGSKRTHQTNQRTGQRRRKRAAMSKQITVSHNHNHRPALKQRATNLREALKKHPIQRAQITNSRRTQHQRHSGHQPPRVATNVTRSPTCTLTPS